MGTKPKFEKTTGEKDGSVEDEIIRREEVRASGPMGVAYIDHVEELVIKTTDAATEHGIPIFILVGMDRPGQDGSSTILSVITGDEERGSFCSDTLLEIFTNLRRVASAGWQPVPPEVAKMVTVGAGKGVEGLLEKIQGIVAEKAGLSPEQLHAGSEHGKMVMANQLDNSDYKEVPDFVVKSIVDWSAQDKGTCHCTLCEAMRRFRTKMEEFREKEAN